MQDQGTAKKKEKNVLHRSDPYDKGLDGRTRSLLNDQCSTVNSVAVSLVGDGDAKQFGAKGREHHMAHTLINNRFICDDHLFCGLQLRFTE